MRHLLWYRGTSDHFLQKQVDVQFAAAVQGNMSSSDQFVEFDPSSLVSDGKISLCSQDLIIGKNFSGIDCRLCGTKILPPAKGTYLQEKVFLSLLNRR